jgi:hypothetical protein
MVVVRPDLPSFPDLPRDGKVGNLFSSEAKESKMDLTALSDAAAALLAQSAAGALADRVSGQALDSVGHIVALVRRRVSDDQNGREVLATVEAQPNEDTNVQTLADLIASWGRDDSDFRHQLESLVGDVDREFSVAQVVTNVFGNARIDKMTTFRDVTGDVVIW